ncbi:MAG: hypothetical protein ABJK43_03180, partial [Lentilitoribacter sp.]
LTWSPALLFLISTAAFHGFGPLVNVLGNPITLEYLARRPIYASPPEVFDAITLSLIGICCVVFGLFLSLGKNPKIGAFVDSTQGFFIRPESATIAILGSGLFLRYILMFPSDWGIVSITIPGFIRTLSTLSDVGFGLLLFVALRRGQWWMLLFAVAWPIHFGLTILALSKNLMVTAMIFPIMGYYIAQRKSGPVALMTLAVVSIYVFSQPIVANARLELRVDGMGGEIVAGPIARAQAVASYFDENNQSVAKIKRFDAQLWWTRLNYTAQQATAMRFKADGVESKSLNQIGIIFIPRIIWPDKPVLRGPGQDFYFLVTGRDNNRMSITLYADLLWQFGWIGLILICIPLGLVFGVMSRIIVPELKVLNFIYIPAALIGMNIALIDLNKFFINGVLTSIPMFFIYLYTIQFFTQRTEHEELAVR